MKIKTLFALVGLTAALGLGLSVTSAEAQGGGLNGGPANPGGFGPMAPGAFGNPMQMRMGGNIIDPASSAKMVLIYRPDVQNALNLDLKQKIALDGLKDVQAQDQQKMRQEMFGLMQGLRGPAQNLSLEDRQQKMQELTNKAQGLAAGYQDDLLKRIDEILTPKQRKRLTALDLRWRGPLSLVDAKVADMAALGAEDKKKVQDSYKEFTDARQKLMESMLPAGMRGRFNGNAVAIPGASANPVTAPPPPAASTPPAVPLTLDEQQAAQRKALRDFEKGRAAMGAKLVATVSPQTAVTWQTMIGAPFTFRDMDQ